MKFPVVESGSRETKNSSSPSVAESFSMLMAVHALSWRRLSDNVTLAGTGIGSKSEFAVCLYDRKIRKKY